MSEAEIVFEPKQFSDCTIVYRNCSFKVHKAILYQKSYYFSACMEGDANESVYTIPEQKDAFGNPITIEDMKTFFDVAMHYNVPNEIEELSKQCQENCFQPAFLHLLHYFDVKKLISFAEKVFHALKSNFDPAQFEVVMNLLFMAETLKWSNAVNTLVPLVGQAYIAHEGNVEFDKQWKQLLPATRESVQLQVIRELRKKSNGSCSAASYSSCGLLGGTLMVTGTNCVLSANNNVANRTISGWTSL